MTSAPPTIQNESGMPLPRGTRQLLARAFALGPRVAGEITVRYVGDGAMRGLNRRFKGKNRTTDVLAFETGDIAVCVDAARRQARSIGHSVRREILHLSLHGFLHLAGRRDGTSAGRAAMDREAEAILDRLERRRRT